MNELLNNEINDIQIPKAEEAFIQWVLAIQQDVIDYGELFQDEDMVNFPEVPDIGGILKTRKGSYEAIFTDASTPVGQWRRIKDNSIYTVGAVIPTTL